MSSSSSSASSVRQRLRDYKIEKLRKHLDKTLPWNFRDHIPRFDQLFSESSSDHEDSFQPFNDVHYDTDVESNCDTPIENKENLSGARGFDANDRLTGVLEQAQARFVHESIVEPTTHHSAFKIDSKIINFSYFDNNKVALNYNIRIWFEETEISAENFVIIFDNITKRVLLQGKGNIQAL